MTIKFDHRVSQPQILPSETKNLMVRPAVESPEPNLQKLTPSFRDDTPSPASDPLAFYNKNRIIAAYNAAQTYHTPGTAAKGVTLTQEQQDILDLQHKLLELASSGKLYLPESVLNALKSENKNKNHPSVGWGTRNALEAFQTQHNMLPIGITPTQALALVNSAEADSTVLHIGSTGASVTDLQNRLDKLDYSKGLTTKAERDAYLQEEKDGKFGRMTELLVKRFQRDHNILPSGVLSGETSKVLNSPDAGKPVAWNGILPKTAQEAIKYFKYQFRSDVFNPDGPGGSNNCGLTSMAMILAMFGRQPKGASGANLTIQTSIDHARALIAMSDVTKSMGSSLVSHYFPNLSFAKKEALEGKLQRVLEKAVVSGFDDGITKEINSILGLPRTEGSGKNAKDLPPLTTEALNKFAWNKPVTIVDGVITYNTPGARTGLDEIKQAFATLGLNSDEGKTWDELDKSLAAGKPVIALGVGYAPGYKTDDPSWGNQFHDPSAEGPDKHIDGLHILSILGKTADGKRYIVSDPMYRNGPVEMTQDQLKVFFKDYKGNPNFIAIDPGFF